MTKDTEEFSQFTDSVTCSEYTSPRVEKSSGLQGWIRGNTKIGPVLEITTSYLQSKYGVVIRIWSVNKDNTHSWVTISHGLNKLVTDLIDKGYEDNEQEASEIKFEEFALKNVLVFANRSEPEAKPRRRSPARSWTDVEPETCSPVAYPVSKQLSTLLRHGYLPRKEYGAIEFWRLKGCLRYEFENSRHWSDEMWKNKMAGRGSNKKKFQCCTDPSGQENLHLRALLKVIQDTIPLILPYGDVLIPNNFFEYIHHIECAINSHSITNLD